MNDNKNAFPQRHAIVDLGEWRRLYRAAVCYPCDEINVSPDTVDESAKRLHLFAYFFTFYSSVLDLIRTGRPSPGSRDPFCRTANQGVQCVV